jgi:hypothetical protein
MIEFAELSRRDNCFGQAIAKPENAESRVAEELCCGDPKIPGLIRLGILN